ncbi:MAG: hypothetical protein ABSD02_23435 [Steroidobacteraceae bacterium]
MTPYALHDPPVFFVISSGASDANSRLAHMLADIRNHARNNATDWRSATKSEIERIALECSVKNWDGYGAQPVSQSAKRHAQRFVDELPFRLGAPEAAADPDGDISLVWDLGPGHVFTVSVSGAGQLSFAGLLGEGRQRHGVEPFEESVPIFIVETLDELHQRAAATRKAAA